MVYYFVIKSLKKSIIAVLLTQIFAMIIESIFIFVINSIPNLNVENIFNSSAGGLIFNVVMAILGLILLKLGVFNKIFNFVITSLETAKNNKVIKYASIIMVLTVAVTSVSYMNLPYKYVLIVNTIILIVDLIIIFKLANLESAYEEINDKYNISMNSLDENAEVLDKYKSANHENKHELEEIRGLALLAKNYEICEYIDVILDTRIKDNEKLLKSTYRLPDSRLRSLLYSKMSKMENKNIHLNLNIEKGIKSRSFSKISNNGIVAICKLFSIYTDNAIEHVSKLKDKVIDINVYIENKYLKIAISNPYKGKLDLEKIDQPGYSSKGKDRGHGLSLAANIISEFRQIENERTISKSSFSQIIVVKLK